MTTDFSEDKFNGKILCLNLNFIFTGLFEWKRLNLQATEYDELFIYTSYTKRSKPVNNGLSDFFPNTVVKLDNVGCPKFSSFSLSLSVPTP